MPGSVLLTDCDTWPATSSGFVSPRRTVLPSSTCGSDSFSPNVGSRHVGLHLLEQILVHAAHHEMLKRSTGARPGWALGCLWASLAVGRRARVPLVVFIVCWSRRQILPLWTAEAVVFFLEYQLPFQILAVADAAAPQRNVGGDSLLLQLGKRSVRPVLTRALVWGRSFSPQTMERDDGTSGKRGGVDEMA